MNVAIPVLEKNIDSPIDSRFGRAQAFLIADLESMKVVAFIENPNVSAGGGAGTNTAQMLINNGVNAIIAGAVGPNALNVLKNARIPVFSATGIATAHQALIAMKDGKLQPITSPSIARHKKW